MGVRNSTLRVWYAIVRWRQSSSPPSPPTVVIDLLKMCCVAFYLFVSENGAHERGHRDTLKLFFFSQSLFGLAAGGFGEKCSFFLYQSLRTLRAAAETKLKSSRATKNNGPNKLLIKTHFPAIAFARSRVYSSKKNQPTTTVRLNKTYFVYAVRVRLATTSFEANLIFVMFFLSLRSSHTLLESEQSSPLDNLLRTRTAPAPTLLNHPHTHTQWMRTKAWLRKRSKTNHRKKVENVKKKRQRWRRRRQPRHPRWRVSGRRGRERERERLGVSARSRSSFPLFVSTLFV